MEVLGIPQTAMASGGELVRAASSIGVNGAYGDARGRADTAATFVAAAALDSPLGDIAAELARCDREIAEIETRPDNVAGQVKAFLVVLGTEDWRREREIILASLSFTDWPFRWAWRARPLRRLDETESRYFGWPCRVAARAPRKNTVLVQFPDGFVCLTSANGLRKRTQSRRAEPSLTARRMAGALAPPPRDASPSLSPHGALRA